MLRMKLILAMTMIMMTNLLVVSADFNTFDDLDRPMENVSPLEEPDLRLIKFTKSCTKSEGLFLSGDRLKLSDFLDLNGRFRNQCQAKLIILFASRELVIDTDLTAEGHELRVVIVAPDWHISGFRKLSLEVETFLGISKSIVNEENLVLLTSRSKFSKLIKLGDEVEIPLSDVFTKRNFFSSANFDADFTDSDLVKALKRGKRDVETEVVVPHEYSFVINDYKAFLREQSGNKYDRKRIMATYEKLETHENFRKYYSAITLVNDFKNLENQFFSFKLKNSKVDLYPFYESLLNQISAYAGQPKSHEKSAQYKKLYAYLYTAALTKMHLIRNNTEPNLIVDVASYMKMVNEKFKDLEQLEKDFNKVRSINEHNDNYKKRFENKIKEATDFIKSDIMPEIANINDLLDKQVDELLSETNKHLEDAEAERVEAIKNQKKMERNMVLGKVFSVLKVCTQVVGFLGPVGGAVGAVVGAGSGIAESVMIDGSAGTQALGALPLGVKNDLANIGAQMKKNKDAVIAETNKKLAIITKEMDSIAKENSMEEEFFGPKNEISRIRTGLEELKKKDDYDPKEMKSLNDQLTSCLKEKEADLKKKSKTTEDKFAKMSRRMETVSMLAQAATTSAVSIINRVKDDRANLDTAKKAVADAETKVRQLQDYEDQIYEMLIPMKKQMFGDLEKVSGELEGQSLVALDVKKWQVQKKLRDTKLQLRKFIAGFEVEDFLVRSVEQLEEVMTTLVNVYDRIESYQEQKILADYLKDITSAEAKAIAMSDRQLDDQVRDLEFLIKSNVVIDEYELSVSALKQWMFPFADHYLGTFELPAHIFNSSSAKLPEIIKTTGENVRKFNDKITSYKSAIHSNDQYIFSAEFSSKYTSSRPFFVWTHRNYRDEMYRLLSGKEISLFADVESSDRDKDAIKFSDLRFDFKAEDAAMQKDLNQVLEGFRVRATHTGNSYYRFKDRVYVLNCESLSLEYSCERNAKGEPLQFNAVYDKIRKGDVMLSPYTMWKVRLIAASGSFAQLNPFNNEVSIELAGFGSYVGKYVEGSDDNVWNRYLY